MFKVILVYRVLKEQWVQQDHREFREFRVFKVIKE